MNITFEKISDYFKKLKIEVAVFPSGNKGAVMIMPAYGRVIGLWSDRGRENHFWVNPAFLESKGAKNPSWANPGGDRLWLSPEREFFIRDLTRPWETYSVPPCLDPGKYFYRIDNKDICLENSGVAMAFASKLKVPFRIVRRIHPLTGYEIESFLGKLDFKGAGYKEEINLAIEKPCPIKVGIWNLVQVCRGAKAMVPVKRSDRYTVFFGNPAGALSCEKGWLKANFEAKEMFKIGLKASWIHGRMFYIKDNNDGSGSLLLRVFPVREDSDYADTPWNSPEDIGYAVQLFCGTKEDGFGELEYHVPAVGGSSGRSRCRTKSFVFAFRDSIEKLQQIEKRFDLKAQPKV